MQRLVARHAVQPPQAEQLLPSAAHSVLPLVLPQQPRALLPPGQPPPHDHIPHPLPLSPTLQEAVELSARRREAAGKLRAAVESVLKDLAMGESRFDVRIGWTPAAAPSGGGREGGARRGAPRLASGSSSSKVVSGRGGVCRRWMQGGAGQLAGADKSEYLASMPPAWLSPNHHRHALLARMHRTRPAFLLPRAGQPPRWRAGGAAVLGGGRPGVPAAVVGARRRGVPLRCWAR